MERRQTAWLGISVVLGVFVTLAVLVGSSAGQGPLLPNMTAGKPAAEPTEAKDIPFPKTVDLLPGVRLVPPNGALQVLGVKFVGVTADNGRKLLLTLVYIALILLLSRGLQRLASGWTRAERNEKYAFWTRQSIRLFTAVVLIVGLFSIWFDDPTRLATALGLVTAGLAFALQKVVTAVAGYFVILRGKTFNVGDRIVMGGVRGDVIALGFIQTTIMEMGQPAPVQDAEPAMWVRSRQYTGRIVTVTNDKIFDTPVYNYTRDFPYIWEEIAPAGRVQRRPGAGRADLAGGGRAAHGSDQRAERGGPAQEMQRRYFMKRTEMRPRVYYRLTDNWLELTVRFIVTEHGIRDMKDAISRDLIRKLDEAGIGIASATFEIVGLPPLRLQNGVPGGNGVG